MKTFQVVIPSPTLNLDCGLDPAEMRADIYTERGRQVDALILGAAIPGNKGAEAAQWQRGWSWSDEAHLAWASIIKALESVPGAAVGEAFGYRVGDGDFAAAIATTVPDDAVVVWGDLVAGGALIDVRDLEDQFN